MKRLIKCIAGILLCSIVCSCNGRTASKTNDILALYSKTIVINEGTSDFDFERTMHIMELISNLESDTNIIVKGELDYAIADSIRELPEGIKVSLDLSEVEVTYIGGFERCTALTSVILPEGAKGIETRAFNDCTSLKTIFIPATVKQISDGAFLGCGKLSEFIVSSKNNNFYAKDGGLYERKTDRLIAWPSAGGNITIPKTCKSIGYFAFKKCNLLTNITIPETVKTIEMHAFDECSSLKEIQISNGVKEIGGDAFLCCTSLEEITIPKSVKKMGYAMFAGCTSLTTITFLNNVDMEKISNYYCDGLLPQLKTLYCNGQRYEWSQFEEEK